MFKISFKVHQKNDNNRTKRVNKSLNRGSMTFMFCVLLGQIIRCCANLFKDFPFYLASFISKRKIDFENEGLRSQYRTPSWLLSTNGLIQIVMRLVDLANGKPCRCYYTCDHTIFMKWVISLNNRTVICRSVTGNVDADDRGDCNSSPCTSYR